MGCLVEVVHYNNLGRENQIWKIKEPGTRIAPRLSLVEQATGIEPATSAWEANVLPLNYACSWYLI